MPRFELPKNIEDIIEGKTLPEGYYKMEIVNEPVLKENKLKREGKTAEEGAGDSIHLKLRVHHEDEEIDGRDFMKYLGWPKELDKDSYMQDGQPKYDWKVRQIAIWATAFSGEYAKGNEISFEQGQMAWVYVTERDTEVVDKKINDLSMDLKTPPVSLKVYKDLVGDNLDDVFEQEEKEKVKKKKK